MKDIKEIERARNAQREEDFAKAEAIIGKAATDALRDLYSYYDTDLYVWLASLFDKDIGGFYFSDSAKETAGYFPDLESTLQILDSMSWCGPLSHYKDPNDPERKAYGFALSADVRAKLACFIIGLQSSEDGYFYHPQWGHNVRASRRGRDLNWATEMLEMLGEKPMYDTPSGVSGVLGAPSMASVDEAPQPKKNASGATPIYLRSVENFEKYLDTLFSTKDTYTAGNEIESQLSQIGNADARLWVKQEKGRKKADYNVTSPAKDGFIERLLNRLYAMQRPDNGLFDKEIDSGTINGLMKLSMTHRYCKVPLPYAEEATRSIIKVAELPDENGDSHMCNNFNLWRTIGDMFGRFPEEKREAIREIMKPHYERMIRATIERLAPHKRKNGGFSYFKVGPCNRSQSAPVGCVSIAESDVNATTIGCMGIAGSLCRSLGVPFIRPYCPEDGDYFLELIAKSPSVKKRQKELGDLYTYDNGEPCPLVAVWPDVYRIPNAKVELTDDRSVLFTKQRNPENASDSDENIRYEIHTTLRTDNGYQVFETDMTIDPAGYEGNFSKITFYSGTESKVVRLSSLRSGEIFFVDKDGEPINWTHIEAGKTYRMRFEYYYAGLSKEIKFYINSMYVATLTNLETSLSVGLKPTVNVWLNSGFDGANIKLKNTYVAFIAGPQLI